MAIAYEDNNIFARILRGELPCYKVYEDEVALAFMDVMPRVDGHVLVIPKIPARNMIDIRPDDLAALITRVQTVALATQRAFGAEGFTIQQFNEEAGGQQVFHIHFHILPRQAGSALRPPGGPMEKPEILSRHADLIRAAF